MSSIITTNELIDAGIHFGHKSAKWNPKMAPFIYSKKNKMHIIDIRETVKGLIQAYRLIERVVASGETVLFVGTKKQAKISIEREARKVGMPYVAERWLGGTFTNTDTLRLRIERLKELEKLEETGEINTHSKKMISMLRRERLKIYRNLNGIRDMNKLPCLVVVIDPSYEHIAVAEAKKCGVPVIGLVDTDSDPDNIDIVIPGNDDAMNSIDLVVQKLAAAVAAGKEKLKNTNFAAQKEGTETTESEVTENADDVVSTQSK